MDSKIYVVKSNVPKTKQSMQDLLEWEKSAIMYFNDNRWLKMWNDHQFVSSIQPTLTSMLVEMKEIKQELRKQREDKSK